MSRTPLCHLIFYGSLLHRAEAAKHGIEAYRLLPVRLEGFRRLFDHVSTRRPGEGDACAVLDVREAPGARMNALLARDVDAESLETLDEREIGYERRKVERRALTPFADDAGAPALPELGALPIYIYYGLPERRRLEIGPIPSYLALCREGADQWGSDFRAAFERQTFLADGERRLSDA